MPRRITTRAVRAVASVPISFELLESRRLLHAGDDRELCAMPASLSSAIDQDLPLAMEDLYPLSSIPALNSYLDAPVDIYLDFDGHDEGTWGSYHNVSTPVYSIDGDLGTFSDSELQVMHEVWAQVAEDFAPFNVNVTTVEPPSFENRVALRVSIGGSGEWYDDYVGGVGYRNSFTNSIDNTVFVFSDNLRYGNAKDVGEVSSHETGHAFGLRHQIEVDSNGNIIEEYYAGADGKAPIMGNSYDARRGIWWLGMSDWGFTIAPQDDMEQIASSTNGFYYRADDHGNTANSATPLSESGNVLTASGIVGSLSDLDYFSFETGGSVTLTVTLPLQNNLDARLELRTATDQVVAFASPGDSFGATLTADVAPGSYRAVVRTQGTYGEVGQYTLVANVFAPTIEGDVFVDADRDGARDAGEASLAGASVFDDRNGNQVWDAEPQFNFMASDTPMAIPADGSAISEVNVAHISGSIVDVNVRVTLSHPNLGNLVLMLLTPQGSITLMDGLSLSGDALTGTVFDSDAPESIYDGAAPYAGAFRPLGNLSSQIGKPPNGRWRLLAFDNTSADAGVIENFELELTVSAPEPQTTTDAAGHYLFSYAAGGVHRIRQVAVPGYSVGSPSGAVYEFVIDTDATFGGLDFANVLPSTVVGRALFYDGSKYDGGTAGINVGDDGAIATDKSAYLAGTGVATFANISSYSRGLNGIMIDIANLGPSLSLDDFQFRVGQDNNLAEWLLAPLPSDIAVRPGAGASGSDRVELVWGDDAVKNAWLEVTLEGNDARGGFNPATGLAVSNTFYFGSRVGDTGSGTAMAAVTSAADELAARYNSGINLPITNLYDFDRSRTVSAIDQLIARFNAGVLLKINLTAPQDMPMAANAVVSALAITEEPEIAIAGTRSVELRPEVEKSAASPPAVHRLLSFDTQIDPISWLESAPADVSTDDDLLDALIG